MPIKTRPALAIHASIRWRHDVLAARRLSGDAEISPGELSPIPCPPDLYGFVFARVARGPNAPIARAPAGSMITVRRAGGAIDLVEGPAEVPLGEGDVAELAIGAFVVAATAYVPEAMPPSERRAGGAWAIAAAAIAHALVLALAAVDARASVVDDEDDRDRIEALRGLMASAEQRTRAADPPPIDDGSSKGEGRNVNEKRGDGRAGGGARAIGDEGKMGDRLAREGRGHYAVPAQIKDDREPSTSRAEAIADASTFGMIGLLTQGPRVPSAAFAEDFANGADRLAVHGNLWAHLATEARGAGGLGLEGIGEGGGGDGLGIGLGRVGTLGHTDGREGSGLGGNGSTLAGSGRLRGSHRAWGGHYGCGGTSVSGRLPPEVIQRIIRQNFGRFRACYENGLRASPNLAGRVTVRFVIGRDGAVSSASNGGSDLPDTSVASCVVRAFFGLSFPQPEGGIVTVTYPIMFSPG